MKVTRLADNITPEGARTIHGLARPNLPRNSAAVSPAAFMDFWRNECTPPPQQNLKRGPGGVTATFRT